MAASDELPRGWTASNTAVSPTAAIVGGVALSGVAHVLDSVHAKVASGAVYPPTDLIVNSSAGTYNNVLLGVVYINPTGTDEVDLEDLGMMMLPGESFYVTFSAAPNAGSVQGIVIQGHDV